MRKGRVYDEAMIAITISNERLNDWEALLGRLRGLGFRNAKPDQTNDNVIDIRYYGSNATNLARAMIDVLPQIIKDIFDAMAFEKWLRIKQIANMEYRYKRGESQIEIANYKFTVHVHRRTVELVHNARDEAEAKKIIEILVSKYGNEFYAYVNKCGRYSVVRVPMRVLTRYDDIKKQVVEVLCRKFERVKSEEKKQEIIKALRRLMAPSKGTVAVCESRSFRFIE